MSTRGRLDLYYMQLISLDQMQQEPQASSQFSPNPSLIHDAAAIRAIAYLYQTKTLVIKYLEESVKKHIFIRASDAAFGDNLVSRKSTEGYLFTLFGGPFLLMPSWGRQLKSIIKNTNRASLSRISTKISNRGCHDHPMYSKPCCVLSSSAVPSLHSLSILMPLTTILQMRWRRYFSPSWSTSLHNLSRVNRNCRLGRSRCI